MTGERPLCSRCGERPVKPSELRRQQLCARCSKHRKNGSKLPSTLRAESTTTSVSRLWAQRIRRLRFTQERNERASPPSKLLGRQ
jgi:hypothetical protein